MANFRRTSLRKKVEQYKEVYAGRIPTSWQNMSLFYAPPIVDGKSQYCVFISALQFYCTLLREVIDWSDEIGPVTIFLRHFQSGALVDHDIDDIVASFNRVMGYPDFDVTDLYGTILAIACALRREGISVGTGSDYEYLISRNYKGFRTGDTPVPENVRSSIVVNDTHALVKFRSCGREFILDSELNSNDAMENYVVALVGCRC